MTKDDAKERLDFALNNPSHTWELECAVNSLAKLATSIASLSGFHDDEKDLQSLLSISNPQKGKYITHERRLELSKWLDSQLLQAEIARMGEELGEAIDNIRRGSPKDDKLSEYTGWHVELIDVIIRILDTLGKREAPVGEILLTKMLFNSTREYKHGKSC